MRRIAAIAAMTAAYYVAARASLLLAIPETNVSPLWIPSGMALGALIVWGRHLAWGVAFGELIANVHVYQINDVMAFWPSVAVSGAFAVGNAAEALLGATLFTKWAPPRIRLDATRSILSIAAAGAVMNVLGASVGVASLLVAGLLPTSAAPFVWLTWWFGNMGGVALVTPVVLALADHEGPLFAPMGRLEAGVLVAAALGFTTVQAAGFLANTPFDLPLFVIAIAFWAALRAGLLGTAMTTLSIALIFLGGIAAGSNPDQGEPALTLQLELGINVGAFFVLLTHSANADRQRAQDAQTRFAAELERRVSAQTKVIKMERDRFAKVFNAALDSIVTCDVHGRVVAANPAAKELLARPDGPVVGTRLTEWIPDAMAANGPFDTQLIRGDKQIPVEVSVSRWRMGGQPFTTAFIRDIRNRQEAQRAVADSVRSHERLERMKERELFRTRFVNQAAHELRTPLTPLLLQASVLRRVEADLSPAGKRSLESMDRNLRRLKRIVDDLLDVGRYEEGKMDLRRDRVDLGRLVKEVSQSRADSIQAAGHALHMDVEDDVTVRGDGDRIAQMLHNLISNAEKYTPHGGRIDVRVMRSMGAGVVMVSDTGIGLTVQDAGALFEPFARVQSTTDVPGTGLGLYLTRSLAELHGGNIDVTSAGLGQGTTFTLRLPIAD